jgi:hypothetical protein
LPYTILTIGALASREILGLEFNIHALQRFDRQSARNCTKGEVFAFAIPQPYSSVGCWP